MRTCAMVFVLACACGRAPARVGSGGPVDAGAEVFADGGVIGSSGTATLLVATSGAGLVRAANGDCRGYCTVRGNDIHLTAVPDSGATFVGWSGACSAGLALDETGAIYWTDHEGPQIGTVRRLQAGAMTTLASGQDPAGGLAVDATHVYFAQFNKAQQGEIRRVPRTGGAVETVVVSGRRYAKAIRVDASNVYFRLSDDGFPSSDTGHVLALSKADFTVRTLSGGNGIDRFQLLPQLEIDGAGVYWNWTSGTPPYGIFRANPDGGGFQPIDSDSDTPWYDLAVDATAVYYVPGGAIIRHPK